MWKLICIVMLFFLCGCSKQRAALHYFKSITAYDKHPSDLIQKFAVSLQQALNKTVAFREEAEGLEKKRERILNALVDAIGSLRNEKTFEDDYSLRDGTIAYFEQLKSMCEQEWKQLVMYRSNLFLTETAYQEIRRVYADLEQKEQYNINAFKNVQIAFADKYQFPLKF